MKSVQQTTVDHSRVSAPQDMAVPGPASAQFADRFAAQLEELRRELRAQAAFLAQDRTAADDLVQEVFERAWVARHQFQPGTSLRAWLNAILRNLFIDTYRRNASRLRGDTQIAYISNDNADDILDVLSIEDVVEALDLLTAADREIFTLAHLDNVSYREISAVLGVSINTVGTRLLRVRMKLRRLLEQVRAHRLVQMRRFVM